MRRYRLLAGTLIILLVVSAAMSAADAIPIADPFRPFPAVEAGGAHAVAGAVKLRLSAVLISPYRRQAVINNRLMTVGAKIGGGRILAIDPRGVLVLRQGKRLWLQLIRRGVLRPEEGGA